MPRYLLALPVLVAALLTVGCIVKDTTHRLYLSPDGAVTWSVLEQDVRSDEDSSAERVREEQTFLDRLASSTHPMAEGLRQLGPDDLSMKLLRRERPFAVMTTARFQRVDWLATRCFEELHIPATAALDRSGDLLTLSIAIDLSRAEEGSDDVETPVAALVEDLDHYRVALTDGRFVSASGFRIGRDGADARLNADDVPLDRPVELTLTWRVVR